MDVIAVLAFISFVICGIVIIKKRNTSSTYIPGTHENYNSSFINQGDNYMGANHNLYMDQPPKYTDNNPFGDTKAQ